MTKEQTKALRLSIYLDDTTYNRLCKYCEADGRSKSFVARMSINKYLDAIDAAAEKKAKRKQVAKKVKKATKSRDKSDSK